MKNPTAHPKTFILQLFALTSLAMALTGCGPNLVEKENSMAMGNILTPDAFSYQSLGDYTCPTTANVLPYEDRLFDGTQRYTVCTNQKSTTKLRISGYSSSDAGICVFPLQFFDDYSFSAKVTPNGQALYSCYSPQTLPTKDLDFAGVGFNGVAIVDQSDASDLIRCLLFGQACPTYSIGRLR